MRDRGSRVLGVLAGEDMPLSMLRAWADSAEYVIAADSGGDRILACGGHIDLLVGDLDSATRQARHSAGEVVQILDQDSTDCDKLLALAAERGFESLTLVSVEGSQPDHFQATLHSALKAKVSVRVAFRRGLGHPLVGPCAENFDTWPGQRVSLIPFGVCEGVTLSRVKWPLSETVLEPTDLSSVSNEATETGVSVGIRSGAAMLYLETGGEPLWP